MDGLYFLAMLIGIAWLAAWSVGAEAASRFWWPFDMAEGPGASDEEVGQAAVPPAGAGGASRHVPAPPRLAGAGKSVCGHREQPLLPWRQRSATTADEEGSNGPSAAPYRRNASQPSYVPWHARGVGATARKRPGR